MSTSKSSRSSRDLRGPIPADLLRKGMELARRYQVVLWEESGEFYGRGLELPYVMEDGPTADACMKKLRQAMGETVGHLLERGEPAPSPVSEARRTAQVNIRITTQEKSLLEQVARAHGYHGISDYVRDRALAAG